MLHRGDSNDGIYHTLHTLLRDYNSSYSILLSIHSITKYNNYVRTETRGCCSWCGAMYCSRLLRRLYSKNTITAITHVTITAHTSDAIAFMSTSLVEASAAAVPKMEQDRRGKWQKVWKMAQLAQSTKYTCVSCLCTVTAFVCECEVCMIHRHQLKCNYQPVHICRVSCINSDKI